MTHEQFFNQFNVTVKSRIDETNFLCEKMDGTRLIVSFHNYTPQIGFVFEAQETFVGSFLTYPESKWMWRIEKVLY